MGYEIDYLPVGKVKNEKSGDAIAMRFWDESPNDSFVIVVDGGTKTSGQELVEHINKYYGIKKVNMAIITHLDNDHVSGMRDVVDQLEVEAMLIIKPWEHARQVYDVVSKSDNRVTENSIRERLEDEFKSAVDLVESAKKKKIKIFEPFAYSKNIPLNKNTNIYLIGPTIEDYINTWLPAYESLPTKKNLIKSFIRSTKIASSQLLNWLTETWDTEILTDPSDDEVSSENNSSVIFQIVQGEEKFLFCGDAGVPALGKALDYADNIGITSSNFDFFHVPHHGSKHNLGPTILNRLFGRPKYFKDSKVHTTAFISCTVDDPKHPSGRVVNALMRRNVKVIPTAGSTILHHSTDYVDRGWGKAKPLEFQNRVIE